MKHHFLFYLEVFREALSIQVVHLVSCWVQQLRSHFLRKLVENSELLRALSQAQLDGRSAELMQEFFASEANPSGNDHGFGEHIHGEGNQCLLVVMVGGRGMSKGDNRDALKNHENEEKQGQKTDLKATINVVVVGNHCVDAHIEHADHCLDHNDWPFPELGKVQLKVLDVMPLVAKRENQQEACHLAEEQKHRTVNQVNLDETVWIEKLVRLAQELKRFLLHLLFSFGLVIHGNEISRGDTFNAGVV